MTDKFENLPLEKFFDESTPGLRKKDGIFYTPRKVAEAMAQQALELWQQQHDSYRDLCNIKVLDPACGDGEFLLSMLDILLKKHLEYQPGADLRKLALQIIKNNLYGIDCNEEALKRLQIRLSGYVNKAIDSKNFIKADSLQEIDASIFFGRKCCFDLVIGNPPYVSYGLRNTGKLSAERAAELRSRFNNSAEYKITLYALFMELAVNSLKDGGVHTFIVPDSFLCGQYFSKLRNFLLQNCTFKQIYLVQQKIFQAVPGNLVIYFLTACKPDPDALTGMTVLKSDEDFSLDKELFIAGQSNWNQNPRQKMRIFADENTFRRVAEIESRKVCTLGDLLTLASGLVAKNGQKSIISKVQENEYFLPGITGGKSVRANEPVVWENEYINTDPAVIKSGLGKIDYRKQKLLIRQTGDRITAAVDTQGLAVLNNLHAGAAKDDKLDLERLASYLNSEEMLFYYQAITMECGRAMAQTDLETLRELPMPEYFKKK